MAKGITTRHASWQEQFVVDDPLLHIVRGRLEGPRAWLCALSLFGAALCARFTFASWLEPEAFLTFFPAVLASSLLCSWRHGLAVLLLSTMAGHYFFIEPTFSLEFRDFAAAMRVFWFLCIGVFTLTLVASLSGAARRLDACMRTQDDLFQELQHRVANNMQFVASMLTAAGQAIKDRAAIEVIDRASARVWSLGQMHRRLYDPQAYASGLNTVLQEILDEAFHGLEVEVYLGLGATELSIKEMTAIVLLVNEAAMNAAKHVFAPRLGTLFAVALRPTCGGRFELSIRDNGPGLPSLAPGQHRGDRLGMEIMHGFARQLGGVLKTLNGPGTAFTVTFAPL